MDSYPGYVDIKSDEWMSAPNGYWNDYDIFNYLILKTKFRQIYRCEMPYGQYIYYSVVKNLTINENLTYKQEEDIPIYDLVVSVTRVDMEVIRDEKLKSLGI